jgi:decaprenyl-phosphate phosphoribosyltransferase
VSIRAYVDIARVDHWPKNILAAPGAALALSADPSASLGPGLVLAFVALCLTASSNYVINELLDAPFDLQHPEKRSRPIPSGLVDKRLAVVEWLLLGAAGIGLAFAAGPSVGASAVALWVMGLIYNIPPVRSKDHPYVDVLSESVNNPIRLWTGWAATGATLIPPLSVLLGYWMLGAFLMAVKRFAELANFEDRAQAAAYRPSFAHYTRERLLFSILAYSAAASTFGGMFMARYRLELVLGVPFLAAFLGYYLSLGFREDSPAARPEFLYRDRRFAVASFGLMALGVALLVVDLPWLVAWFEPSIGTIFDRAP